MQFIQYHHISYNGVQYYYLDSDIEIPNEYIPFGDSVKVQVVDKDGIPYNEDLFEEAFTYRNDDRIIYLYFQSAVFTKDTSKAAPWNLY